MVRRIVVEKSVGNHALIRWRFYSYPPQIMPVMIDTYSPIL